MLTALSDRAFVMRLPITLDDGGRITDLGQATILPVEKDGGAPLEKGEADLEEIHPDKDGWLITREGRHDAARLHLHDAAATLGDVLVDLSDTPALRSNKSFEAAALLSDGSWIFLSEGKTKEGHAPARHWDGKTAASSFGYLPAPGFAVTGATADPKDGWVYVLERAFDRKLGPRARVARFRATDLIEGALIEPIELLRFGFLEGADNMEGISFYEARDGSDNLALISDDNFSDLQRTVLITFKLGVCPSTPAEAAAGADQTAQGSIDE
jgi:hypothetical protein